jgi:hypothetical protein
MNMRDAITQALTLLNAGPTERYDRKPLPERWMTPRGGVADRYYQDEAAANPGPFTTQEYIEALRERQEFKENNRLLQLQGWGKQT